MSLFKDLELEQCPDCPSPVLVPWTEMTNHIALLHQGEAFQCAVCKVLQPTTRET